MNADVYYDTETGVVGTNMFVYCNNNPIMFVDPTGFYIYSQLSTVVNTIKLIILISYIMEYAKENRDGFSEENFIQYINRITTKNTTFSQFINRIEKSVSITSNGVLWAIPSEASFLSDLLEIADIGFAKFVADAALAASSVSGGNAVVGILVGVLAYLAINGLSDELKDGFRYT